MTAGKLSFQSLRLLLFPLCSFLFTATFWMIMAFLPIYLTSLGIPGDHLGFILGMYSLAGLGFIIPFGILADRLSPRKVLYTGGICMLAHVIILKYAFAEYLIFLATFVGGLGLNIFQTVLFALYLKVIPEDHRGLRVSIFQMGFFLGFGVGPLIGGHLWNIGGYNLVLKTSIYAVVLLILCYALLPESPISRFSWNEYREDVLQKKTLLFLILYFVYALHFGVEHTGFSMLMKRELHFSAGEIGLVYMAVGIWMTLLAPLTGHQFDIHPRITPFLIGGMVVSSLFHIATAFVNSVNHMILVRILHTLGDSPVIFATGLLTSTLFPQRRLGGNSAVVQTVRTVGVFTGNAMTGIIASMVGYGGAFVYTGIFFLMSALLFLPFVYAYFDSSRVSDSPA